MGTPPPSSSSRRSRRRRPSSPRRTRLFSCRGRRVRSRFDAGAGQARAPTRGASPRTRRAPRTPAADARGNRGITGAPDDDAHRFTDATQLDGDGVSTATEGHARGDVRGSSDSSDGRDEEIIAVETTTDGRQLFLFEPRAPHPRCARAAASVAKVTTAPRPTTSGQPSPTEKASAVARRRTISESSPLGVRRRIRRVSHGGRGRRHSTSRVGEPVYEPGPEEEKHARRRRHG